MRLTHGRNAIFLLQIEPDNGNGSVPLPVGKPCERQQAGWLNLSIFSLDGDGLSVTGASHHPLTARAQVRLHMSHLETSVAPPLDPRGRISQRFKDAPAGCVIAWRDPSSLLSAFLAF